MNAQQVHQLLARDRMHPGRQGLIDAVSVALVMHREQGFLHKILNVIWPMKKFFPEKSAQVHAQRFQEFVVGACVAVQSPQQQLFQPLLVVPGPDVFLYSFNGAVGLHAE